MNLASRFNGWNETMGDCASRSDAWSASPGWLTSRIISLPVRRRYATWWIF